MLELPSIDVSRETLSQLRSYVDMITKWSSKINLVSKGTEKDIWNRHIVDSAQIHTLIPLNSRLVGDFGSGGGLPAIVLAILDRSEADRSYVMIESDQRKAVFLRSCIREFDLSAEVVSARVEDVPPLGADCITSRALAPLDKLLGYTDRHLSPSGVAIFPKGRSFAKELLQANSNWRYEHLEHQSITDSEAKLIEIRGIQRV